MSIPSPIEPGAILQREREEAYALLAEVVRENHDAGRRSYGASVKPELRRRTFDGFDEARLRFDTFSQFLHAAGDAGHVVVEKAPRGPDVMLAPPGQTPISDAAHGRDGRSRIRRDLWYCFVDWDERYKRAYDSGRDIAERYPASPAPLEPPDRAEFRQMVADDPERFHPIDPIPFATQLDWMREFAATVDDPLAHGELRTALATSRPVRAFTQALAIHPSLRSHWNARRQALIEVEIRRWMEHNGLEFDIYDTSGEEPSEGPEVGEVAPATSEPVAHGEDERLDRMRERLKRIIDRMPASELERISIPYGYTFDA